MVFSYRKYGGGSKGTPGFAGVKGEGLKKLAVKCDFVGIYQ